MREVLISPGFGAGWSTWSSEKYREFLLFDKGLIELAKRKATETEVKEYIKEKLGENVYIYTGGWDDVVVVNVEDDDKFIVEEYDGSESLRFKDSEVWY